MIYTSRWDVLAKHDMVAGHQVLTHIRRYFHLLLFTKTLKPLSCTSTCKLKVSAQSTYWLNDSGLCWLCHSMRLLYLFVALLSFVLSKLKIHPVAIFSLLGKGRSLCYITSMVNSSRQTDKLLQSVTFHPNGVYWSNLSWSKHGSSNQSVLNYLNVHSLSSFISPLCTFFFLAEEWC